MRQVRREKFFSQIFVKKHPSRGKISREIDFSRFRSPKMLSNRVKYEKSVFLVKLHHVRIFSEHFHVVNVEISFIIVCHKFFCSLKCLSQILLRKKL